MYFADLSAALHMDGHGIYVWSAYLITLVVVGVMTVMPWRRQRRLLKQLSGEIKRQSVTGGGLMEGR